MRQCVALIARFQAAPSWNSPIVPVLTVLIYGILAPAVFLLILITGVELAWPGGTRLRQLLRMARPLPSRATSRLRAEPHFRTLCTVGGLIAVAVLSVVMTAWLAGYWRTITAPQLAAANASPGNLLYFLFTLGAGLMGGFGWATGMRLARDARACLRILAISLSLSGTTLFFYLVEPVLHDTLLSLALGVFLGELTVAARHPTLLGEGLFAELLTPDYMSLPFLASPDASDTDMDHGGEVTDAMDTVDAAGWHTHSAGDEVAPRALIGAGQRPAETEDDDDQRDPAAPTNSQTGATGDRP